MIVAEMALFAAEQIVPEAKPMVFIYVIFGVLCLAAVIAVGATVAKAHRRYQERGEGRDRNGMTVVAALRPLWIGTTLALAAAVVLGYLIVGSWAGWAQGHNDSRPRIAVAANPATPEAILSELAADAYDTVRVAVASNPSTGPETLLLLAVDVGENVRLAVASNLSTGPDALSLLAADVDEDVRTAVGGHPSTSPDALLKLIPAAPDPR